ncbi:MAG: hypothetical protein KDM91_16585 [Verrucomicrobiae bacterium]|nr:hypothetical protein [Verrucomicrobiae bacterium]MCP5551520.1 hypothetical protein [Akkermansiaceae bacterium]
MMSFLVVVGVVLLAAGLRTFESALLRKLGAVAILVASYLAAWFATGSHAAGVAGVFVWFLLPWIELLTRVRKLRLPLRKSLKPQAPPSSQRFPHLSEFTEEIEEAGFDYVSDAGWEWDGLKQFFRVFYHAERRTQAVIGYNEQETLAFVYVAVTSRAGEDRVYRTWNYPFSYTMRTSPNIRLNRVENAPTFEALLEEHADFLHRLAIDPGDLLDENPESLLEQMERETAEQIAHNLNRGLLRIDPEDAGNFRYSWRGLFFLYRQLVIDMVRLS